jgi:predicted GNAT family N-acyltransferase
VTLSAQIHARGFYERAGFHVVGEPFMDAGIPHRKMVKDLAVPSAQS